MKKFFAVLFVLCVTCLSAVAGPLKVSQGDKKFFSKGSGTAVVEINWDNAKYDNGRVTLQDEYKNELSEVKSKALSGFTEGFNDKSKKLNVKSGDADYKFTINVTNVDRRTKIMTVSWSYGPATSIWGTLTVTNQKTGEVVLVVDIDEMSGNNDFDAADSMERAFTKLGEKVAKL